MSLNYFQILKANRSENRFPSESEFQTEIRELIEFFCKCLKILQKFCKCRTSFSEIVPKTIHQEVNQSIISGGESEVNAILASRCCSRGARLARPRPRRRPAPRRSGRPAPSLLPRRREGLRRSIDALEPIWKISKCCKFRSRPCGLLIDMY